METGVSRSREASERVAVITGCSSGFGLSTAIVLAQKGFRVVATMRDTGKKAALEAEAGRAGVARRLDIRRLDVTDEAAIEETVSAVLAEYGRIDLLVNNAGFAMGGFVEDVPLADWRKQLETNFFGLVAMTRAVIPAMRERRSGTIVHVSSVSGRIAFPGYGPYAASKFAVEGFGETLRHELAPFGVRVVLVEPGAYKTPIWEKGLGAIRGRPGSPYEERLLAVLAYSRKAAETAPDPREVAERIGRIADDPAPRLRYALGKGSRVLLAAKALLPWRLLERIVARALK
ncbi:SDR family oxidoreductase [Paenibacillus flagellatus]|uniref:Short-chain dehydrogenase n=1 Tax=Paenibacillus flagellatus TaxID=2211139 RepID=A0A2V5K959_9BACL|nr:SDR family oxidoreductase [Paenibacillus flagellatus]PYI54624.1 short-chain dehydrogenase [Paenibacillus flagellatus]